MSTIDPAFLWETEALRERRTGSTATRMAEPSRPGGVEPEATPEEHGFVTLVAASEETGIPVNTLRKWARRGAIVSYLDETGPKPVRMISMDAVRSRAAALGREISALASAPTVVDPHTRLTVDLTRVEREGARGDEDQVGSRTAPDGVAEPDPTAEAASEGAAAAGFFFEETEATQSQKAAVEPPPGTMIVPISAWEKMLIQLGNLHEAGKEMAEARERAAKAETEAAFLRERLKELRAELESPPADRPAPAPPRDQTPEPRREAVTAPAVDRMRGAWRQIRRRFSGG